MNKAEYLDKKNLLNRKHQEENSFLAKQFVLTNAKAKIGEFVTDHTGTVKVERITATMGFAKDFPEGCYYGTCYTKAGKPFKSNEKRSVYGGNIESGKKS
ncbi:MAG: hypothetical protein P9L97_06245 [Candidatus Tenebribacter davisii]|nr:hypothetical protein [Candidatus Tenebribacter davisii]